MLRNPWDQDRCKADPVDGSECCADCTSQTVRACPTLVDGDLGPEPCGRATVGDRCDEHTPQRAGLHLYRPIGLDLRDRPSTPTPPVLVPPTWLDEVVGYPAPLQPWPQPQPGDRAILAQLREDARRLTTALRWAAAGALVALLLLWLVTR